MITYNHGVYIREAIKGVLMQQTSFLVELIIGEDCSKDGTRKICQEYAYKYPNKIKLLLHKENIGSIANFIATVKACNNKYIALCDGDDYWTDPYKLQKQVDFLEQNPEYGLVYTDFNIINSYGLLNNESEVLNFKNKLEKRFKSGVVFFDLLEGNFIPTPTVCLKREVLDPLIPLMIGKTYIVDYWIWFHISVSYKVKFLNYITAKYRRHPEGATSNQNIVNHRNKSGPIYYDILIYFYKNGKFDGNNGHNRAIVFRSCLTSFRSKELKITKQLHLLILAIYFFSFKGIMSLIKKKLLRQPVCY
jgi:glycosyltransferase involved in cell wall biosynthesis